MIDKIQMMAGLAGYGWEDFRFIIGGGINYEFAAYDPKDDEPIKLMVIKQPEPGMWVVLGRFPSDPESTYQRCGTLRQQPDGTFKALDYGLKNGKICWDMGSQ